MKMCILNDKFWFGALDFSHNAFMQRMVPNRIDGDAKAFCTKWRSEFLQALGMAL